MPDLSDEQLIANYLKGDEKSLEILIKKYLNQIYNFIYSYLKNEVDTEDATQETFVKVWKNLKKFKKQKKFKPWLFVIAKNTALDVLKKSRALPFSAFDTENRENKITDNLLDPSPLPDEIFDQTNKQNLLNSNLEKLSIEHRSVFSLYHNNHLNFREISEKTKEPINTVKSRYRRAIAKLKKLLA